MGHSTLNKQTCSHIEAACCILVQRRHVCRNRLKACRQGMRWLKREGYLDHHILMHSVLACSCQITKEFLRSCGFNPVLHVLLRFQGLQRRIKLWARIHAGLATMQLPDATTSSNLFPRISHQLISIDINFKGFSKGCSVDWSSNSGLWRCVGCLGRWRQWERVQLSEIDIDLAGDRIREYIGYIQHLSYVRMCICIYIYTYIHTHCLSYLCEYCVLYHTIKWYIYIYTYNIYIYTYNIYIYIHILTYYIVHTLWMMPGTYPR